MFDIELSTLFIVSLFMSYDIRITINILFGYFDLYYQKNTKHNKIIEDEYIKYGEKISIMSRYLSKYPYIFSLQL